MTHLISTGLQNKKDVLFGNMEEIYHFHNRSGPPSGRPRASGYALLGEKIPPSLSRGISGRTAGSVGRAQGSSLGGGELQGAAHRGRKRELAPRCTHSALLGDTEATPLGEAPCPARLERTATPQVPSCPPSPRGSTRGLSVAVGKGCVVLLGPLTLSSLGGSRGRSV